MTEKPMLAALAGETLKTPPIWLMRQAGRYLPEYRKLRAETGSFLDLCYNPVKAAEATLQPIHRFAMDAAILFSDILVVPDAMGQKVGFREGEGPVLDAVRDRRAIEALDPEAVVGRLAPVYETVSRVSRELPDTCAMIGFAGAPWTVATYMVEGGTSKDFRSVKALAYGDRDGFSELIDRLVAATIGHLAAQVDAGAEILQIFDTWAGILPEDAFDDWCVEPTRRIVSGLRERNVSVPIIGFPRGVGLSYGRYAEAVGVEGVSLDTSVPLDWAAEHLQSQVTVQGNLDPVLLTVGGAAMDGAIRRIVERLGSGPYIFNLGHGVLPQTPPENVAALVEAVRSC
ncbi:MAG: uroporphyrinogen decarboxylase [Alphaproteobacteria bacterium]